MIYHFPEYQFTHLSAMIKTLLIDSLGIDRLLNFCQSGNCKFFFSHILNCISQVTNEVNHLLIYLLAVCFFSFVK